MLIGIMSVHLKILRIYLLVGQSLNYLNLTSYGFEGTSFLKDHSIPWITAIDRISIDSPAEERKVELKTTRVSQDWTILERFSSLKSLLRFTSLFVRLVTFIYKRSSEVTQAKFWIFRLKFFDIEKVGHGVFSFEEMQQSEMIWIYLSQHQYKT